MISSTQVKRGVFGMIHALANVPWESVASMATYTAPVRALIEASVEPVVLVGHSMGGVALSYLAAEMPDKFKNLVYLTAFMTPPGKTANDYIFSYAENPVAASLFAILAPVNEGAGLQLDVEKPDRIRDAFYGDCSDADVRVAGKNTVVINTSVPNVYAPEALPSMPKHYIFCTDDHAIPLSIQKQMIEEAPGAAVHSMSSSHSPFFSQPEQLAELLAEISVG